MLNCSRFHDEVSSRAAMIELFSSIFAGWMPEWMVDCTGATRGDKQPCDDFNIMWTAWHGWHNCARERDDHY